MGIGGEDPEYGENYRVVVWDEPGAYVTRVSLLEPFNAVLLEGEIPPPRRQIRILELATSYQRANEQPLLAVQPTR